MSKSSFFDQGQSSKGFFMEDQSQPDEESNFFDSVFGSLSASSPFSAGNSSRSKLSSKNADSFQGSTRPAFPPSSSTSPSKLSHTDVQKRTCPHCRKVFSRAFSITKHIHRVHNRAGELHCPKCTFKTRSPSVMEAHEKEKHRTCPHCNKIFVLLDRHIGSCEKSEHSDQAP